ncbi:tRNA (adenosine(37)-N6)-threonylcarbamoyltransferase complex ATPase subunit type 1 TsaE [Bacteroidota bacterium]
MKQELIIHTNSEQETIAAGFQFAGELKPDNIVLFYGELGAGKTEFIKGICSFFEVDALVTSPTFTIINQYYGNFDGKEIPIFHIDLYRIKSKKELDEIGYNEFIYTPDSIKLIEWAEKSYNEYTDDSYIIKIQHDEEIEDRRVITISKPIMS